MAGIFEREPGRSWPRSQKFRLTPKGVESEAGYRAAIVAARAEPGRSSFDSARATWASALSLEPADGLCLVELQAKSMTIAELVKALESCGSTRGEVKLSIDRLTAAGLVEPVVAPAPPEPPRRPW